MNSPAIKLTVEQIEAMRPTNGCLPYDQEWLARLHALCNLALASLQPPVREVVAFQVPLGGQKIVPRIPTAEMCIALMERINQAPESADQIKVIQMALMAAIDAAPDSPALDERSFDEFWARYQRESWESSGGDRLDGRQMPAHWGDAFKHHMRISWQAAIASGGEAG